MSEKKKESPARDGAGRFVKAGGAAAPAVVLSEEERAALRAKELAEAKAILQVETEEKEEAAILRRQVTDDR